MDVLNDYHPMYPDNPETSSMSESEHCENEQYIAKLDSINNSRKRKKDLTFDDFCTKHSDDLWHLWCIIEEYSRISGLLNTLEYSSFCSLTYENSTKY